MLGNAHAQGVIDELKHEAQDEVEHFLMSLPTSTDKKDRHIVQKVFQALERSRVYAILDTSIDRLLASTGSVPTAIAVSQPHRTRRLRLRARARAPGPPRTTLPPPGPAQVFSRFPFF